MTRSTLHRRIGTALAVVLAAAAATLGQGLTGTILGTVKDETGGVLPGVAVTVSSPSLIGGSQVRSTDSNGAFRFPVLPPGEYKLVFELMSFQPVDRTGIVVRPDRTATVDVVLRPAAVAELVTVVGETPLVDVRNTQVATTMDTTVVEQVPIARRFSDVLNLLPGVVNGLYTFSPINAVYGSSVKDNVYTVEGISFVDPAVSSPSTDIPYDDIEEVQVSTSGQFAEFGNASGGAFNFITKSGSNQLSGLVNGYLQTKGLTADNLSEELAAQGIQPTLFDHVYDWGGNVGGPIAPDKLWFFGSYYNLDQREFLSDFDEGILTEQWTASGKLDGQLSPKNRYSIYYNYRNRDMPWGSWNAGFETRDDPRTWGGIVWDNHLAAFGWTSTPDSQTVIQLRGGFSLFDLLNTEPFLEPGAPVYIDESTGIQTGGPDNTDNLEQRDGFEFKADASRFIVRALGGSHDLKAGFSFERLRWHRDNFDKALASDLRHLLLDGEPYRVVLLNFEGETNTCIDHPAAFVQDQWALGQVTINLGLRFDHWTGRVGPDTLTGGSWFEAEQHPARDVISLANFAPRLGLAWDVKGDHSLAVKAAYGRFYQRLDGARISFLWPARRGSLTYDWIDRNGDLVYQPGEEGTLRGDSRPLTQGEVDPDLKMPYTDSFNAGVELDLPRDFGLTVNVIYKRERDVFSRIDRARPFDRAYDQVPVVNPIDAQTMTVFSVKPEFQALPPVRVLTNPSDPVRLYRDYKGFELLLHRRLKDRWMMHASYNLGRGSGTVGTFFFDHHSGLYENPNNLINVEGDQQIDRRHILKLIGLYEFPHGIQLSGHFEYLAGLPVFTSASGGRGVTGARFVRFTRQQYPGIQTSAFIQVPGEPQGSIRLDAQSFLDLRLEKEFRFAERMSLDVMLDVFNLFNANTVTRVESLVAAQSNFLRPAEIMSPRAARIGVRFKF